MDNVGQCWMTHYSIRPFSKSLHSRDLVHLDQLLLVSPTEEMGMLATNQMGGACTKAEEVVTPCRPRWNGDILNKHVTSHFARRMM